MADSYMAVQGLDDKNTSADGSNSVQLAARAASKHVPSRQRGKAKKAQTLDQFEKLPAYLRDNVRFQCSLKIDDVEQFTYVTSFKSPFTIARPCGGYCSSMCSKQSDIVPKWLTSYLLQEFIVTSYRINYTIKQTLLSLFRVHNETGNVWTHLIGNVLRQSSAHA